MGRWPELVPDTGSWTWHGRSPGTLETIEILEGRGGGLRETEADNPTLVSLKWIYKKHGVQGRWNPHALRVGLDFCKTQQMASYPEALRSC